MAAQCRNFCPHKLIRVCGGYHPGAEHAAKVGDEVIRVCRGYHPGTEHAAKAGDEVIRVCGATTLAQSMQQRLAMR